MKIQVLKSIQIDGIHYECGDVAEVSESMSYELLNYKRAIKYVEPKVTSKPKPKPKPKKTVK